MKTVGFDQIIEKPRSSAAKPLSARHRFSGKNTMRRGWLWIIPILAALSAIWIQAVVHGFVSDFTPQPTVRVEQHVATETIKSFP